MQSIKTTSIAKWIAQIEDILLRETQAIKLIFRPLILDNVWNPEASLKWVFIYQKKWKNDDWTDIENIPFTSLKKWEWYKLELHSEEVLKLLGSFVQIKELYNHFWIKYWENEFFITEKNIDSIFDKLSSIDNKEMILEWLNKLDFDKLENIESLVNINRLTRIVSDIKNNLDNDDEKWFWQPLFKNQSWIISQIFSSPFLFVDDEFFVWWKRWNNNWWVSTDYLYENSLTKNVAFIEVKTPNAKLVEWSLYRWKNDWDHNAIYSPSKELTWPVNQVLNQKNLFIQKKDSLEEGDKKTFNSKCILIAWNMSTLSEWQQKSFELYRNSLREVEIITFDELLLKIENILKIFSWWNHQEKEKLIDDIPF
jgi:hypothetical protein